MRDHDRRMISYDPKVEHRLDRAETVFANIDLMRNFVRGARYDETGSALVLGNAADLLADDPKRSVTVFDLKQLMSSFLRATKTKTPDAISASAAYGIVANVYLRLVGSDYSVALPEPQPVKFDL